MTINSARSTAQLFAQVTPGDPTASGSYEMGATGSRLNFTDVNQVYALKVSNQGGDGDLNLKTGTYTTAGGATFAGGDGKDPDGQDVDLTNIYGIQVINTGDADLTIMGFRKEALKHDPHETFNGFPDLGNMLFVHTDRPKEIG